MATSALQARCISVAYQPVFDVDRGTAAGYQAQPHYDAPQELDAYAPSPLHNDPDGALAAAGLRAAFAAMPTRPRNTFVSVPVGVNAAPTAAVADVLLERDDLHGIVLDIVGFSAATPVGPFDDALAAFREAGARIAVGGNGAAQPELSSIVRLKPAILRLGQDWVRGLDHSETKRSTIEVIGRLAGQLDAWILAEGVSTPAELRELARLRVPLAQGPFIGEPHPSWPRFDSHAALALPAHPDDADGMLRSLIQPAYTTTDGAAAAAVLPETTGFDVVVVLDGHQRPQSIMEQDGGEIWTCPDVLTVNIDTPVADAVARAMARPHAVRFTPLACTDAAGRFLGILRIDRLMRHLVGDPDPTAR